MVAFPKAAPLAYGISCTEGWLVHPPLSCQSGVRQNRPNPPEEAWLS